MKKTTYDRQYAETKVTNDMTVLEAKKAKQKLNRLKKYFENAAVKHIKQNDDVDLTAPDWTYYTFSMVNNTSAGKVTIVQYGSGDQGHPSRKIRTWNISKAQLLTGETK